MTNAQKMLLEKIAALGVPSFRLAGRCISTYDTERKGWYPKMLFGRGEAVAFRSLVEAGKIVLNVLYTAADGHKLCDGYKVKGQFCNCDTCGDLVKRDSLMVDDEGASYCEKCRQNNVVEGLRAFMRGES